MAAVNGRLDDGNGEHHDGVFYCRSTSRTSHLMASMNELLAEHFEYLADAVKLRCYRAALQQVVRPGDVVLDLGCGSGVLGLIALEAGAGFVYFLDRTAILEVAKLTVAGAGLSNRAAFLNESSFEATLPEQVDVVICDHIGYFGVDYGIRELLADARARFLKPGGRLVPTRLELKLAAVSSPACRNLIGRWRGDEVPAAYRWLGSVQAHAKNGVSLTPDDILACAPGGLSIALGEPSPQLLSWSAHFDCDRQGLFDGIAGWFECELADGIWMTNSPLAKDRVSRSQVFLGLDEPVPVEAGERVEATVMLRPDDSLIAWRIRWRDREFVHSTWNTLALDGENFTRDRRDRPAQLNHRGAIEQAVLASCDGTRTVGDIENLVSQDHTDLMPTPQALSAIIMQVLGRCTRR